MTLLFTVQACNRDLFVVSGEPSCGPTELYRKIFCIISVSFLLSFVFPIDVRLHILYGQWVNMRLERNGKTLKSCWKTAKYCQLVKYIIDVDSHVTKLGACSYQFLKTPACPLAVVKSKYEKILKKTHHICGTRLCINRLNLPPSVLRRFALFSVLYLVFSQGQDSQSQRLFGICTVNRSVDIYSRVWWC